MAEPLTDRQRQVLELYVIAAQHAMPQPTYRSIGHELDFSSTHATHCHVHALIKKGWLIKPTRGTRAFILSDHTRRIYGLPGRVAA